MTAPARTVLVLDAALPPGRAANAAAVLAVSLGARVPQLVGPDAVDADGGHHPGLIDRGLPVLRAPAERLGPLRERALAEDGVDAIGFPAFGQATTDYAAYTAQLAATSAGELRFLGLAISGPRRAVTRLTGDLPLLR